MTDYYAAAEANLRCLPEGNVPTEAAKAVGSLATARAVLAAVDELRALRPNLDRLAGALDAWAAHTAAAPAPAAAPRDDEEPTVPVDPLHVLISEWQNTTCSDRNVQWSLRDCADRLQRVIEEHQR